MDALSNFPKQTQKLYTQKGTAVCQKIDIFKELMWYCYEGEWMNWHTLKTDQVHEIIAKNKAKETVASLEQYAIEVIVEKQDTFENVVGQDSLTRFDQPKSRSKNNRKRRNNKTDRSNSTNLKSNNNTQQSTATTGVREGRPKRKPRPNNKNNNRPDTSKKQAPNDQKTQPPAGNKNSKPKLNVRKKRNNNNSKPPKKED
jgi:hypothetical protein